MNYHPEYTSPFVESELEYHRDRIKRGLSSTSHPRARHRVRSWIAKADRAVR